MEAFKLTVIFYLTFAWLEAERNFAFVPSLSSSSSSRPELHQANPLPQAATTITWLSHPPRALQEALVAYDRLYLSKQQLLRLNAPMTKRKKTAFPSLIASSSAPSGSAAVPHYHTIFSHLRPGKPDPRCAVCGGPGTFTCGSCFMDAYCSHDHQQAHYAELHKPYCDALTTAIKKVTKEENKLRRPRVLGRYLGRPLAEGEDIFHACAGKFYSILESRDYMMARANLIWTLEAMFTSLSVAEAIHHILDCLYLCRGDEIGLRDSLPPLYLRLGRDQVRRI